MVSVVPPPPPPPLLPLQPASTAEATTKSATTPYAYARRGPRMRSMARYRISAIAANSAASHSNGVERGRLSKFTGGANAVSVVVNDAVHEAPDVTCPLELDTAPLGVHVTAVPRFVAPFWNCTVPVGPCAELLFDEIVAVSVTDAPDVMLLGLAATPACVVAGVMVTDSVFVFV